MRGQIWNSPFNRLNTPKSGLSVPLVQGITQYGVHNLLERVGISLGLKTMYLIKRRQTTRNSLLITNSRCFCITQDQFFFNIPEWAFIRGSIFGEIFSKIGIFGVQTGEWASIGAWASNRNFTASLYL